MDIPPRLTRATHDPLSAVEGIKGIPQEVQEALGRRQVSALCVYTVQCLLF